MVQYSELCRRAILAPLAPPMSAEEAGVSIDRRHEKLQAALYEAQRTNADRELTEACEEYINRQEEEVVMREAIENLPGARSTYRSTFPRQAGARAVALLDALRQFLQCVAAGCYEALREPTGEDLLRDAHAHRPELESTMKVCVRVAA